MLTTPPDARRAFKRYALIAALTALLLALLVRSCTDRAAGVALPPTARNSPALLAAAPAAPIAPRDAVASTAHRMRALTFAMDASGVRLEQTTDAPGRVKAPPLSIAPYRLEFEVYDRDGQKLYAGSFDHPLHRTYEYEDPDRPGSLRHAAHDVTSEMFQVRLPAELPAVRVAFFEVRPDTDAAVRTALGTILLP